MWVPAWAVNEVRQIAKPAGIGVNAQWFDADLSEQVLVAYENDKPVYATLVSSGKNNATPLGIYPVWARVAAITMKSQPYDDKPYFVNMVPWSTFFQAHNAIHGAYWHDRFGNRRSHGCVNVAPLDAKWLFDWVGPALPRGWTGYLPSSLEHAPVVHVRDSSRPQGLQFTQSRPIGPPDAEEERRKTEAAQKRRAEKAALDAELEVGTPLWPEGGDAP